jgi:hypothetical protein
MKFEGFLLAVLFAVAHTQSPLFYSNQNQYLLHGAAIAGDGQLAGDWLATTRDPAPLASAIVAACYRLHPATLHALHFALMMAYFAVARTVARSIVDTPAGRLGFAVLFIAVHAGFVRWLSVRLTGFDYPWFLQAGLAAQYLVGPGFQPSALGGVLLFAAVANADRSPLRVGALAGLACLAHSTYLLPAGLLVGSVLIVQARRGVPWRSLVAAGGVSLWLVAWPVHVAVRDFLSDPDGRAEAMRLLADVRIPHHCRPARWFDAIAAVQIAWMAIGLWLLRNRPIGVALAIAAAGCVALTVAQIATGSHALALLFPWRLSVVLVPLATTVAIAVAVNRIGAWPSMASWLGTIALSISGIAVMAFGLGYRTDDGEWPLYRHVRATAKPGDVYFVPARFPKVSSGRGAVSNTFAPPPRMAQGTNQIPIDLQRFRLAAGAAIFVDFKSVPYAVPEVLEWHRRMTLADRWTAEATWTATRIDELRREGITHLVVPATATVTQGRETYRDESYAIYRIGGE